MSKKGKKGKKKKEDKKFKSPFSIKQVIFFILSIALLIYVFRYVGLRNMYNTVKTIKLIYLLPIVILLAIEVLLDAYRGKLVIDETDKVPFSKVVPIYLVGMLFNALTPGSKNGGEFVKSYYLSKISKKINYYAALAIYLINGIFFMLTFWSLSVIAILATILFANISANLAGLLFLIVLLAAIIGIIVFALHHNRHALAQSKLIDLGLKINYWLTKHRSYDSYSSYKSKAILKLAKFCGTWVKYTKKKKLMRNNMLIVALMLAAYFLKVYVIFLSLNVRVGILTVIAVTIISRFVGYLLILPGGIGVTEATMISLYAVFGIAPGVAAAVTLIDRATYYLFNTYGSGLVAWGWLSFRHHVKPTVEELAEKVGNGNSNGKDKCRKD